MSTLNIAAANPAGRLLPPFTSLDPHRRPFVSSLSVRIAAPRLQHFSRSSIRASSQNHVPETIKRPGNFFKFQINTQNNIPEISLNRILTPLRATLITTITGVALFFSGFYFSLKPSIAEPISSPPTTGTTVRDSISEEERENVIEENLRSDPHDVDGLKNLMEIKIKGKKIPEAIDILDKLIKLEPEEMEWPMMKSHLYAYGGETELARNGFNEMLKKDRFRVEAYHGLVTVASQEESSEELADIRKRIEEAMTLCKKENKKSDLRDFKLLLAQIRVLEERYDEALKVYEELVKEEPGDFRPYLCQGIVYTLLKKGSEAEKNFEKYRGLVPKGHPYAQFFDDNMIATKIFAQKMENERATAKS